MNTILITIGIILYIVIGFIAGNYRYKTFIESRKDSLEYKDNAYKLRDVAGSEAFLIMMIWPIGLLVLVLNKIVRSIIKFLDK